MSSSESSKFASFAAYAPPPDDPSYISSSRAAARTWFPTETSYQSGGVPSFSTVASGGLGSSEGVENQQNQWETRYGNRVDVLAALAYLFGPISAFLLLIVETHNDFVRFHAYQSALLTTPLIVLRILMSLLQFPQWTRTLITLVIVGAQLYMAFRAFRDASRNSLVRYHLPTIGQIAEDWLAEE
ncbi:uncharacterized protein BT62DRAFT_517357 [Guyanagaster necrorhizus]|uniref:Uncharacterized protein n=1 Tax=Guyanagaster necrorhizus TaxID=856835 RepID=A0A9P7W0U5_9AGAR|nr:uncharacterized protein BT62DRAFT_517357 [Guyanagaster necrorhizus MCA 3950]KAG7450504.1 hypothetical protein BT62DRAFT_517357 [Guyanagaster necrorhizus MCA 3950]